MGFKLVRIDATEPYKIPLPVGTHYIGRGVFLNCDDHRVSRMHGLLDVSTDTVKIKALHPNPCFYKKNQSEQLLVLNKDEVTDLTNGSQFGLVPDSYWYEVIYCHETKELPSLPGSVKVPEKPVPQTAGQINNSTDRTKENESTQRYKLNAEINGAVNAISRDINGASDRDETVCEENDRNDSANLLSLKFDDSMSEGRGIPDSSSLIPGETNPTTSPPNDAAHQANEVDSSSPNKRTHSPEEDSGNSVVKKIKVEPESPQNEPGSRHVKTEPQSPNDAKIPPQNNDVAMPGPSRDPGPSHADGNNNASPPVQAPKPPARERCIYGEKCYRLNVQHKAQFSHPGDADYGPGARGVCPYGAACLRRDPRHWDAHTHPPGTQPAAHAPRPGKRDTKPRVVNQSESEEDELPPVDVIVDGKRKRKPVQGERRSESEEEAGDPYATDESDEWEPPGDDDVTTGSQSRD